MKTEIYGTFGPACDSEDVLKEMIKAGMTGMRLNLSHTTLVNSKDMVNNYHHAAKEMGIKPQILIDMQGPELRVGKLQDSIYIAQKEKVFLVTNVQDHLEIKSNENKHISVPDEVLEALEPEDEILLDDGKILVRVVEELEQKVFVVEVIRGGLLQSHKSIKIVGKNISLPALTAHDIENIKVAKDYGVTALMQPFVSSGAQLREVRSVLTEYGADDVQIFAKIENRIGLENIDNILSEADVIIIARGDLGNDVPLWELPRVQKQIEKACQKANKPYIVVTQMLASMERNPVPTRAEVSDIYHAVYHGAWGVMLTGETAVGEYPVEAIRYLANTAQVAQKDIS